MKVKCTNCGRTLAEGNLPATVKIKCPKCKVVNDLNVQDKTKPFTERLELEKKERNIPTYTNLEKGIIGKMIKPGNDEVY